MELVIIHLSDDISIYSNFNSSIFISWGIILHKFIVEYLTISQLHSTTILFVQNKLIQ